MWTTFLFMRKMQVCRIHQTGGITVNPNCEKEFGEKVGYSLSAILKIETNHNHATDKTLHDIADTFDVGFEWLKFGDERYRKSPVNRKLIEWLMDHQEIRDQLWKKMMDEE